MLDKLPIGIVMLDETGRILSYSGVAAELLGKDRLEGSIGKLLRDIHKKQTHSTIDWLLFKSREEGSRFASMLIHVPDTILQLRVVRLWHHDELSGFCVVIYDITEITSQPADAMNEEDASPVGERQLVKIPVTAQGQISLLDIDKVVYLQAKGHYTQAHTVDASYFCNMSIGQLESRLPREKFLRVHRSYIVSMAYISGVQRRDDQYIVLMEDMGQTELPVGRSKITYLRNLFGL